MDGKRFDNLTRVLARRFSRRHLTSASVAVFIPAAPLTTLAQSESCRIAFSALTGSGPSTGTAYEGEIELIVDSDGLASGSFTPSGGAALTVAGSVGGRALDIQIVLADQSRLSVSGVSGDFIDRCTGPMGGIFAGPELGDVGVWQAGKAGQTTGAVVGGSNGTGSSSRNSEVGTQSASSAPVGGVCPTGMELCQDRCVVGCGAAGISPETCECGPECPQGQVFCPGGTTCSDPQTDAQNCGICGNACDPGESCVFGSCCASAGSNCSDGTECCTQYCHVNTCVFCSDVEFNGQVGVGTLCRNECVDLQTSTSHCGFCFYQCQPVDRSKCCSGDCVQFNDDPLNCGDCGVKCGAGQICRFAECVPA